MGSVCTVDEAGGNVIAFDDAAVRLRLIRELRLEAEALISTFGQNPYSDFLFKNGRRPDPGQAATIGRLIGIRVRASDGSLQPTPTKAQRAEARRSKTRRQVEADYFEQVMRLRTALVQLSKNNSDPAEIIAYVDPLFGDDSLIREHLARAVRWINRFAEEWEHEQETGGGQR
jgi:hypothetical protein